MHGDSRAIEETAWVVPELRPGGRPEPWGDMAARKAEELGEMKRHEAVGGLGLDPTST